MEIIRNLDNRLFELIIRKCHSSDENIKHRSLLTMFAIGVPFSAFTLLRGITGMLSSIAIIAIIGSLIFGIMISIAALYEWRHFFSLRRRGLNHDQNLFFEESAGKYRKLAFYVCLPSLVVMELFHIGASKDLRYLFKADFYLLLGVTIFKDVLGMVVSIELLRIGIPSAAMWSNRKHLALVISFSVLVSVLSAIGLGLRGHSIF